MPERAGWKSMRNLNIFAVVMALLCVIGARWYGVLAAFMACLFTWQATVAWCIWHKDRDGINVWEKRQ